MISEHTLLLGIHIVGIFIAIIDHIAITIEIGIGTGYVIQIPVAILIVVAR